MDDSSAVPGGIDSSAVPGGIDPDTQMMYERCYKAGFDQYHKWLIANHPDDAIEWHKKEQELQKQEEELKYISKFLVQSVPAAKSDPKPAQRVSGARVFTSEECIRMLEEKEAEKKRKEEEKQQNKLERERKRREREEIAAEKKKRKEDKQTATKPKQKAVKHKPKKREKDATENDSMCPICSSMYSLDVEEGNGRDWIQCACGIWLHDDCIPEAIVEAIIQEKEKEKEATELHCCPECIDYDDY